MKHPGVRAKIATDKWSLVETSHHVAKWTQEALIAWSQ